MTQRKTGIALVALAAALWGTDALFRRGLALELPAATVVFFEHLVLVLVTLPWLIRSRGKVARLGLGDWVALVMIGAGASATATILFTMAFSYGDPNTPLLLQKLQPLVAVMGARLLLGEALLSRYWIFLVAGLGGAYLIAFPDPLQASVSQLAPALLAVGAAALWGMGTVLGRRLSARLEFRELTAWRFAIGMPVAGLIWVLQSGGPVGLSDGRDFLAIVALALVPGLAAMLIYYRGLSRTPASAATLAELAFPVSAALVNYLAFDAVLTLSQWAGMILLAGAITWMSVLGARDPEQVGVVVRPSLAPSG
ncbi:MAG: DMT family transporter [Acidimicrobiia bacterium]|jgi:DME family drug/metabolite transporter|nr:DMT family transporter [Acidimicrobiia bacterium]